MTSRWIQNLLFPPVIAAGALACDSFSPDVCVDPTSEGVRQEALVNGKADADRIFDAVICIGGTRGADGKTAPCASGTLITPNLILTARHLGAIAPGESRAIQFGPEAREKPLFVTRAVKCWDFRQSGTTDCHVPMAATDFLLTDLAVWQLERRVAGDLPQSYEVTPIPVALESPQGGEVVNRPGIIVGYGSSDNCYSPQAPSGIRRFGGVKIVGASPYDDAITGAGTAVPEAPQTLLTAVYNPAWPFTAPGDSGGPLLVNFGTSDFGTSNDRCISRAGLRVVGTITRGCNYSFSSTIHRDVSAHLRTLLDPDGDGVQMGFADSPGEGKKDQDLDGISDANDNCPKAFNPDQLDSDGNGIGDDCE